MEYINIPLYVIRSNEYIGADPTQRATWLSLIAWSCDQENMGRIAGARSWGDRRWMQSCGVMASEVAESCGLFRWDGDDLVISFYPADAQREIERKREIARANGRKGGRKPTPEPIPETNVGSDVGTQPWIANEAPLESEKKGKEKKGNIGGETTTVDSTPGEEVPAAPVLPAQSFPNRERLNDVRGMRCADNHADLGASPGAARFMAACLEINPSWSRTMPTAIEQAAALEAYCSAQGRVTPRDMEMLRDYYASGLTEDCKKKAFGVRTAGGSFGSASGMCSPTRTAGPKRRDGSRHPLGRSQNPKNHGSRKGLLWMSWTPQQKLHLYGRKWE